MHWTEILGLFDIAALVLLVVLLLVSRRGWKHACEEAWQACDAWEVRATRAEEELHRIHA